MAHKTATTAQVFADPAIGAVLICSYTDTHADLILAAAAAGKQIFCEKPVDLAIARARTCAEAVARAGVTCMIGFQRRFDPTFAALKKRLAAGEIGTPEMLVVTSRDPGAPPIPYIKSSGGIFKDMLIHDFDVFRWILDDEAETVHANASCLVDPAIAEAGDVDSTAVTIRTKRGRLCQINTSRRAAYGYDQRFEVLGSGGMLQAGNHAPTEVVASTTTAVVARPARAFLPRALSRGVRERDGPLLRGARRQGEAAHDHRRRLEGARARRSRDHVLARGSDRPDGVNGRSRSARVA